MATQIVYLSLWIPAVLITLFKVIKAVGSACLIAVAGVGGALLKALRVVVSTVGKAITHAVSAAGGCAGCPLCACPALLSPLLTVGLPAPLLAAGPVVMAICIILLFISPCILTPLCPPIVIIEIPIAIMAIIGIIAIIAVGGFVPALLAGIAATVAAIPGCPLIAVIAVLAMVVPMFLVFLVGSVILGGSPVFAGLISLATAIPCLPPPP